MIKDINSKDLTQKKKRLVRGGKNTEELYKKGLNDLDIHDGMVNSPTARYPGVQSQGGLRKNYYKQSWEGFAFARSPPHPVNQAFLAGIVNGSSHRVHAQMQGRYGAIIWLSLLIPQLMRTN